MEPIILNVDSLPLQIRKKFSVKKVSVTEDKENIILAPVTENKKYEDPIYLLKPDPSKKPLPGRLKDSIEILPDFDEPLEEMKEYMY